MRDILPQVQKWQAQGERIALASVVRSGGHAPRGVGSTMAIRGDGAFAGSVSGGCIEGAVIQAALEVLSAGTTQLLSFGGELSSVWEVGLSCGGSVQVLVYELAKDVRNAAVGDVVEVVHEGLAYEIPVLGREPDLQLVCIGAVHIASELITLAKRIGYTAIVIDPRKAFLTEERFPHADRLVALWPQEAFKTVTVNEHTAICALTHDPKIDVPALAIALQSDAFYIGSLGRSTTQAKRVEELREAGASAQDVGRIHGPIGLNLGGRSPEEIALSIMAQITAARYGNDMPGHRMSDFVA